MEFLNPIIVKKTIPDEKSVISADSESNVHTNQCFCCTTLLRVQSEGAGAPTIPPGSLLLDYLLWMRRHKEAIANDAQFSRLIASFRPTAFIVP